MKLNSITFLWLVGVMIVEVLAGCTSKHASAPDASTESSAEMEQPMVAPIELRSEKLTSRNGLPDNSIRKIYQDSKGFLWFATLNGLSRYDGTRFLVYKKEKSGLSLSDNRVKNLTEDSHGRLWVATNSSHFSCFDLRQSRFVDYTDGKGSMNDRYTNLVKTQSGDVWLFGTMNGSRRVAVSNGEIESEVYGRETLGTDSVMMVSEGSRGDIWIGTSRGLFQWRGKQLRRIPEVKTGIQFALRVNEREWFVSPSGNVYKTGSGNAVSWVGQLSLAQGEELNGALEVENRWMIFTTKATYGVDLHSGRIVRNEGQWNLANAKVVNDNRGGHWLANHTGILYKVESNGSLRPFQMMPAGRIGYIDEERYTVVRDKRGLTWISTYGNGLFVYNETTGQMQHFVAGADANSPVVSNYLQTLYEDRSGSMWVSSEYGGLSHLWVMNEGVSRIFMDKPSVYDRSNTIRMIQKEADGSVLVSTRTGKLLNYSNDLTQVRGSAQYDVNIYAFRKDNEGKIWMGTREKGLLIDGKSYRHTAEISSLSSDKIFSLLPDRKGRMWIGTFGGGLNLAVKGTDGTYTFKHFFTKGSYDQREVRYLLEDKNGWIWMGTSDGLYVFNPDLLIKDSHAYFYYNTTNGALRSNEVRFIMQDRKGRMWLAMPGSGVAMCAVSGNDYGHLKFTVYGVENGLANDMVQTVVEDKAGRLWVPTEYGLSRFNLVEKTFENFYFSQYILGDSYSENSAVCLNDGRLLLGTNYGLVLVDPHRTLKTEDKVAVTYTGLSVNGQEVRPGETDSPLKGALAYEKEIQLAHEQNTFTVDFSTFDYNQGRDVRYSCRLKGYEKEWSSLSPNSFVSYKNLSPGTYYLQTKACDAAGQWSSESVLKIVVQPPVYLTVWAFLFYIVVVGVIVYFVYRNVRDMSRLRDKVKLEEGLTKYKLVFFTNIAHEFRTPLTLIRGSLEKLHRSGRLQGEQLSSLRIMDKSVDRLLRLINQLLEFRKMQNNKLSLALEKVDVMSLLKEIFSCFKDAAESKRIDYRFCPSVNAYSMYMDKGHVDKMVYNLLSNAFKYTPSDGHISLIAEVDEMNKVLKISVKDSGVGVPKEKQKELFSRFMQSEYSGDSFGIGLHLTRELARVHHGGISYKDNPGGGSVFTITLPLDEGVYEKKDFLLKDNTILKEEEAQHRIQTEVHADIQYKTENETLPARPLNKRKVLLIEDDNDVRDFLKGELSVYFEMEAASDGNSGLDMAKKSDVDLIISDVMMPGMNGFEVTKRLKNNFETSHIPIILLTALDNAESHLEGVESGADAYITKPFSPSLLIARVFKLIEQREKLKEKFSKDVKTDRPALCSTAKDKEFADRLVRVMNAQLGNSSFSVDMFASMMQLGRTVFFRKVKGVTGFTPNEYIRIMRMKKAAELLMDDSLTVSEVAYRVGVDDPFYFSKCFKQQFGVSPSAYKKGERKKDE